jgi:hypothetical protein
LWRSDGTAARTTPVRDINPGPGDGIVLPSRYSFTVIGGELFFAATDGVHGSQLWISDGTPDGTQPVSTTLAFPDPDTLKPMANINGSLFFTANDGIHGFQPWIIPADQIEDLKDHEGGGHHDGRGRPEGRALSAHDVKLGDHDAALAAISTSGQRSVVLPGGMTWNGPSVSPRQHQPVASPALMVGPLGPLGILRLRVIQDLAHRQRSPFGSLADVGLGRPA